MVCLNDIINKAEEMLKTNKKLIDSLAPDVNLMIQIKNIINSCI
jgi:hypothetical protein